MEESVIRNDIEYVAHCEANGKIIGPISKKHAHMKGVREVLTHYTTWSMVYHLDSGKYGIQQKNPNKQNDIYAGKWDMGIAGHNCYIEENGIYRLLNFEENLKKEAMEEIGLDLKIFDTVEEFLQSFKDVTLQTTGVIFEKFHDITSINNEYVGLGFVLVSTTRVEFVDGEVSDFVWKTPKELNEFLNTYNNYSPALPVAFKKCEKFRKDICE